MGGLWHEMFLVAIGSAAGYVICTMGLLLWFAADVFAARDTCEAALWPDERSVTVWTGQDWFTATVMPVAFGRWGVAVCHEAVPRRAEPLELTTRVRSEELAMARAHELAGAALEGQRTETLAIAVRATGR